MDYGQPNSSPSQESYFTAGVGNAPENLNPDAENSLNASAYAQNHNLKNLGNVATNTAIFSPNTPDLNLEETSNHNAEKPANSFGEVVDLEMPPTTPGLNNENTASTVQPFNPDVIKTVEKLHKSAVKEVEAAQTKFKQDGRTADFYEIIRGENGMTAKNLENSYNRKVAA